MQSCPAANAPSPSFLSVPAAPSPAFDGPPTASSASGPVRLSILLAAERQDGVDAGEIREALTTVAWGLKHVGKASGGIASISKARISSAWKTQNQSFNVRCCYTTGHWPLQRVFSSSSFFYFIFLKLITLFPQLKIKLPIFVTCELMVARTFWFIAQTCELRSPFLNLSKKVHLISLLAEWLHRC